ncbi:hypothetical protein AHAS_Ahas20G0172900 [Arachis hypogaea]
MLLFPFSLRDKATQWLETFPKESITNWDDLVSKFHAKFYPSQRVIKLKKNVQTSKQLEGESLYEAWKRQERSWTTLQEGSLQMMKTAQEAHDLIDMVANNQYFYSSERQAAPKRGVYELEGVDAILAQNKLMHQQLQQQIEMMSKRMDGLQLAAVSTINQPPIVCGQSEESYEAYNTEQKHEQVQDMHNPNSGQNDFHGDTYNPSWRNHPNLKQLSKKPAKRPTNAFPSDTILNPKEESKEIQLRSGKTLEDDTKVTSKEGTKDEENDQKNSKKKEEPQASKKGKQVLEEQPQEQRREVKPYVLPLPYPQRLHKEIKDQ